MRAGHIDSRARRLAILLATLVVPAISTFAQFGPSGFWTSLGPATAPARIIALAADPRPDRQVLYLAAPGGGVWRSEDGGLLWVPSMDGAVSQQVCSVAVNPLLPDNLFAGTGDELAPRPLQGVARSSDGGRSWTFGPGFSNRPVCALAVDPQSGTRVLAGSSDGLYLSTDGAITWRRVLSRSVTDVSFDGQGNVFATFVVATGDTGARESLLARSADGGLTWTDIPLPTSENGSSKTSWSTVLARGNSLFVAITYTAPLFTDPQLDFLRSTDGGASWALVAGIAAAGTRAKIVLDSDGRTLYLASRDLLRSTSAGDAWNRIPATGRRFAAAVITGSTVILAGEQGIEAVPLSVEGRSGSPEILPLGDYLGVTFDTAGIPWAGGPAGLFGRLGGLTDWTQAVASAGIGSVAAAPTGTVRNIFAAGRTAVFRSTDGGQAFSPVTVIPATEARAPYPPLVMDPVTFATAYTAGRRIYRTIDSGATWQALGTVDPDTTRVVSALAIAGFARSVMFAATVCLPEVTPAARCINSTSIFRSQNSGASWTRVAAVNGYVSDLAADPRNPAIVYAVVGGFSGGPSSVAGYEAGDVLRLQQSPDGTLAATSIRSNLPQVPINAIAIAPATGGGGPALPAQNIYVGTDVGVFATFNAGVYWMSVSAGLPVTPVTDLALRMPQGTLHASTFGRGVYRMSVRDLAFSVVASPMSLDVSLLQGGSARVGTSINSVSLSAIDYTVTALEPWLTPDQPGGTLQPRGSAQVTFRVSAQGLGTGTYRGRIRLTSGTLVQDIWVKLRVATAPARIAAVAGDNASGRVGTSLPPFVVQVSDEEGAPLSGVPITFAIVSGGGSLSSRNASSDANGRASTVLTLPTVTGVTRVTATAGPVSATFSATATTQSTTPSVQISAAVNGASFSATAPVAAGSIVAIFGRGMAAAAASAAELPLPAVLAGTRALLAGSGATVELPLFYVSPDQVNALIPLDVQPGSYELVMENNGGRSEPVRVAVAALAPGIFTVNSSGRGAGIFTRADGSLITTTNPARRGNVIVLYATGLGAVAPPVAAGAPGSSAEPLNRTLVTPSVRFDIYEAEVLFSGLAPGFAGLYQVNVRVPALVSPATNVPVSIVMEGVAGNTVTMPVQ